MGKRWINNGQAVFFAVFPKRPKEKKREENKPELLLIFVFNFIRLVYLSSCCDFFLSGEFCSCIILRRGQRMVILTCA